MLRWLSQCRYLTLVYKRLGPNSLEKHCLGRDSARVPNPPSSMIWYLAPFSFWLTLQYPHSPPPALIISRYLHLLNEALRANAWIIFPGKINFSVIPFSSNDQQASQSEEFGDREIPNKISLKTNAHQVFSFLIKWFH